MQTGTEKEPFLHKLTIKALAGQTVVSSLSAMKFNAQSRSLFFFHYFVMFSPAGKHESGFVPGGREELAA